MLKNASKLELTVNGKLYQFFFDNDSPIAHIKESLFQMQKYVGMVEDNVNAQQEQAKKDKAALESAVEVKEEPKTEV